MRQNELFIVILNWNGWQDTKTCIESVIEKTRFIKYTIILTDNGSSMEEMRAIEDYCSSKFDSVISINREMIVDGYIENRGKSELCQFDSIIVLIKNSENLGFARGNNVALEYVRSIGGRYCLLLNNDTEVENEALDKLYSFILSAHCAAVIPQIRYYSPNDIVWNCGGRINFLGLRKYDYALKHFRDVPQTGFKKIDYGTGCALLLDLDQTGLLSEKFFFGEEDFELAFRLRKLKKDVICLYDSIIYHKVGASRVKISEEKIGNMVYHYSQRLSNLKEQLAYPIWCLSVLAHSLSAFRLLYKEPFFNISKFFNMWKDVLNNVKAIKRFERDDYLRITAKKY